MAFMGDFRGFISSYGSGFFTLMLLVVADHLWSEDIFACPCLGKINKDMKNVYISAFLGVPPCLIIIIDTHMKSCSKMFCCPKTKIHRRCSIMGHLVFRPLLIGTIWVIFNVMQSKLLDCISEDEKCNCPENGNNIRRTFNNTTFNEALEDCNVDNLEKRSLRAFGIATTAWVITGIVCAVSIIWGCSFSCFSSCLSKVKCQSCQKQETTEPEGCLSRVKCQKEETTEPKDLVDHLHEDHNIQLKTVTELLKQGVLKQELLVEMPEKDLNRLNISFGQKHHLRMFQQSTKNLITQLTNYGLEAETVEKLQKRGLLYKEYLRADLDDPKIKIISSLNLSAKQEKLLKDFISNNTEADSTEKKEQPRKEQTNTGPAG